LIKINVRTEKEPVALRYFDPTHRRLSPQLPVQKKFVQPWIVKRFFVIVITNRVSKYGFTLAHHRCSERTSSW
jgi:hypothetical protein